MTTTYRPYSLRPITTTSCRVLATRPYAFGNLRPAIVCAHCTVTAIGCAWYAYTPTAFKLHPVPTTSVYTCGKWVRRRWTLANTVSTNCVATNMLSNASHGQMTWRHRRSAKRTKFLRKWYRRCRKRNTVRTCARAHVIKQSKYGTQSRSNACTRWSVTITGYVLYNSIRVASIF